MISSPARKRHYGVETPAPRDHQAVPRHLALTNLKAQIRDSFRDQAFRLALKVETLRAG
jgi:hypothetical protein